MGSLKQYTFDRQHTSTAGRKLYTVNAYLIFSEVLSVYTGSNETCLYNIYDMILVSNRGYDGLVSYVALVLCN
jgi:hypothetical protein